MGGWNGACWVVNGCLFYPPTRLLNPILQMRKSRLRNTHHLLGRATPISVVMRMGQGQVGQWMPRRCGEPGLPPWAAAPNCCHQDLTRTRPQKRESGGRGPSSPAPPLRVQRGCPGSRRTWLKSRWRGRGRACTSPAACRPPLSCRPAHGGGTSHRASLVSTCPAPVPGLPLLGPVAVAFTTSSEPDMGRGQRG